MKKTTKSLHAKVDTSNDAPISTPIYQASAFEAHSDFFYSRKNNPNVEEFEQAVGLLEDTKHALATTTGMSAVTMTLHLLKPGQHLIINKFLYGCSYKLFQWFCNQYQIKLSILNLSDKDKWDELPMADMVFFETPTNPFLYTVNIEKISALFKAKNKDTLIVVDNTWATPLFQQPCKHGADISLHSATKYFGGHSDVMGGIILTDNELIYNDLLSNRFYFGSNLGPYSAWLLRRSLFTLDVRLAKHKTTTLELKEFLEKRKEVARIYYPDVDGIQLTDYATLIFFELAEEFKDKYTQLAQSLYLFSTGTGMACVTSMIAQPFSGSHASMEYSERHEMGLDERLVRLSFGLEDVQDLMSDLRQGLDALHD